MSQRERALKAYTDGRGSQFSLSCAALPRVGEGAAAKLEGACIRLAQGQPRTPLEAEVMLRSAQEMRFVSRFAFEIGRSSSHHSMKEVLQFRLK